jgi:hypothetical protein
MRTAGDISASSVLDGSVGGLRASGRRRHGPSRLGRMSSVHTPATTRSARRKLRERRRERLSINSCCLTRTDSATHGTRPARTGEPSDSRQDVEKQDGQVAHGTIVTIWRNPRNANELGTRHAQDSDYPALTDLKASFRLVTLPKTPSATLRSLRRPVGLELPVLALNPGLSNVARRRTSALR